MKHILLILLVAVMCGCSSADATYCSDSGVIVAIRSTSDGYYWVKIRNQNRMDVWTETNFITDKKYSIGDSIKFVKK